MLNYTLQRFLQLIPILFGITFLSFLLMYMAGSDAVTEMYTNRGVEVAQEIIDARKAELGLNLPFFRQYLSWLQAMLHGNMGMSYVTGEPVLESFLRKLPATILLTTLSILLTVVISLPLGILAAVRHNKAEDLILRFFSFIGNAMPNFFVAMLLMQLLGIQLNLLPVISGGTDWQSTIMPTMTLAIAMSAKYLRQVRSTVLEELNKDYVLGAKARGVSRKVILWKNVMKSAMLTIMTLLTLSIGSLLGGTAIIESIFMWDGVGKLAVDAINMRDYPLIQAYVMWMAIIYVVVNLIADLLYHHLDPRIRLGGEPQVNDVTVRIQTVKKDRLKYKLIAFSILALLLIAAAFFSESLCPYDPYEQNLAIAKAAPSAEHLLGTDRFGRDMFSRIIAGSYTSIFSTLLLVGFITVFGSLIGIVCAWSGKWIDTLLMRLADMFLAFPGLVFALAVAAVLGGGVHNAILALAAISWPKYARLARSQALAQQSATYMQAAKMAGNSTFQMIYKHVIPNISGPILITAMLDIGTMMMELAGLSFLGLGAKPPIPEWGSMMSDTRNLLATHPWVTLSPGVAIFVSVMVFNLLGDTVRDWLDPKNRR